MEHSFAFDAAANFRLLAGTANPSLAKEISRQLQQPLIDVNITRFADCEIFVQIREHVRGNDVFVLQPTSHPVNDNLMELLIIGDALRRASPRRMTAVIPYFGYARQDRKTAPRTPITARLAADLITAAGYDRVLTLDLHAAQIQGFFNIPTDNLYAAPLFADDIVKRYGMGDDLLVVSPDVGGVVRARHLADKLGAGIAIVDKRRPAPGQSEVMNIIGDVRNRRCIMVDDMVDSGGTLCHAAEALRAKGAVAVSAYLSHGVLSGNAAERIQNSALDELVVTDSIALSAASQQASKIRVLSAAPLLAEAIVRIASSQSVSTLFD